MTNAKSYYRCIFSFLVVIVCFSSGLSLNAQTIWLADSHLLSNYQTDDNISQLLQFQKLTTANTWEPSNIDEIWASSDGNTRTYVFLHGNDTDKNGAIQDGYLIARHLRAAHPDSNFRLVIWYWDSRRTSLPLRQDILLKKHRSDYLSFYLAWFVQQAAEHTPVGLIGYSFGANSVLGASHLLAGGTIFNHGLAEAGSETAFALKQPVKALLIAPAVPSTALCGGLDSRNQSLKSLSEVSLTVNNIDPALRWYHLLFAGSGVKPRAMGFVGVDGIPPFGVGKVRIYPMEDVTGASHKLDRYLSCNSLIQQFCLTAELALK